MQKILFIIFFHISTVALYANSNFSLTGKLTSPQGFVIPNSYVQIWEKGEVIAQTKTNNAGEYDLPIPKLGVFTIIAGNKTLYFHPIRLKEVKFTAQKKYTQDFTLKIDIQKLKEECVRLREVYRHMIHNPKNMIYRRNFIQRFPHNGLEIELFFSKEVKDSNLKKEAKRYMYTLFQQGLLSKSTYIIKFIQIAQHTDMRYAHEQTQKFFEYAVDLIKNNTSIVFKELSTTNTKKISRFFDWIFSSGEFGTTTMTTKFDYLLEMYPVVYALMVKSYNSYKTTLK